MKFMALGLGEARIGNCKITKVFSVLEFSLKAFLCGSYNNLEETILSWGSQVQD